MAETVYGPGKTPEQCAAIVAELLAQPGSAPVLLTRADVSQLEAVTAANPGATVTGHGPYVTVVWRVAPTRPDRVLVVTAGTADLPVADECAATLDAHGLPPLRVSDVGVAGLHRVLDAADELAAADAIVVVAGMEGALASVVGGLSAAPIIAVPTSVGYGAAFEGVTALLAMLASCASGVTVVGIDNGFGAACAVVRLLGARVDDEATRMPERAEPGDGTVAWFHCFCGIAGDMAIGALVDAGADLDEVCALCERLPVGGWQVDAESVMRSGIGGTKIHVHVEESTVVRTAAHVTALVEEARLPDRIRRRALATFDVLARAEGHLHRRPAEQVHFHEVGGIDAIVDVVGTCSALEVLGVDSVASSAVANGIGMVRTAHGLHAQPGARRHRAVPRGADLRARHLARADDADRRGAARGPRRALGADAGHDDRRRRLRCRHDRARRSTEPHPGRGRHPRCGARQRPAGDVARGQRGRRHWRAAVGCGR